MDALYLIGPPGAGKSTLMLELLRGWEVRPYVRFTEREMFGHYLRRGVEFGAYLGHLRPEYPGTDALSMSVAPHALTWLQDVPTLGLSRVFGEGTRLSHLGFLQALSSVANLTVGYLDAPDDVLASRRTSRGGKELSDRYCKLATSKARNAAQACRTAGIRVVDLDATEPVEKLVHALG